MCEIEKFLRCLGIMNTIQSNFHRKVPMTLSEGGFSYSTVSSDNNISDHVTSLTMFWYSTYVAYHMDVRRQFSCRSFGEDVHPGRRGTMTDK